MSKQELLWVHRSGTLGWRAQKSCDVAHSAAGYFCSQGADCTCRLLESELCNDLLSCSTTFCPHELWLFRGLMNIVCLRKNVETSATLPAHLPRLISPSCSQPSMRSKQLLLRGSTIKESVLGNDFFFKEVAMQAPETKKRQTKLWRIPSQYTSGVSVVFFSASTEQPLCATWQPAASPLSTHTEKKCKNSMDAPQGPGLSCLHTQAHSFQLLDERQRDRHMKRVCKPRPDGPL